MGRAKPAWTCALSSQTGLRSPKVVWLKCVEQSVETETGGREIDWEAAGVVMVALVLHLNHTKVGHP